LDFISDQGLAKITWILSPIKGLPKSLGFYLRSRACQNHLDFISDQGLAKITCEISQEYRQAASSI
jgi:hypothetical protein